MNLQEIFKLLYDKYGKQYWWPGETPDEIIIGAILTQNTNWSNVEKAIKKLKYNCVCDLKSIIEIDLFMLADLIMPAGFFNIKAQRLKDVALELYNKNFEQMDTELFRAYLLSIKGIGPETADSILLYAYNRVSFVIDSYTMRLAKRMGFGWEKIYYDELKQIFEDNLPRDVILYNEFHALIVKNAKLACKTKPDCVMCPLKEICALGRLK